MSGHNKVIWSEGLFLQPQHFQQQERYLERYVETRCQALTPYSWGFADVEVERDFLGIGKFGLRRAVAVFPDGTPVRFPDDDPLPAPLDIGSNVRGQIVHLAVPLRRPQAVEAERADGRDELTRQQIREVEARNVASASPEAAVLEVGGLRTRFLLQSDVTAAYACIPVAYVVECRADKQVVLDEEFIPTVLQVKAATRLAKFLEELLGFIRQRGENLARDSTAGRGTTTEITDFLTLQVLNRYEPVVAHLAGSPQVHPEELFRLCAALGGELTTFLTSSRRPPALPPYVHEQLRQTFDPLVKLLRDLFGAEIKRRAVQIPIEKKRFGLNVATVSDRTLYSTAVFILAARADLPTEELRKRFPLQLKIGPVDEIKNLVNFQLPGVPVNAVPVAPPQIPYHAGFAYFELDQRHELWSRLTSSASVAIYVGGEFPGLTLEFWAIRAPE